MAAHLFDGAAALMYRDHPTGPRVLAAVGTESIFERGDVPDVGLPFPDDPRGATGPTVVDDLAEAGPLADHPLVTGRSDQLQGDASIRFCAGVPLERAGDDRRGVLCVLDTTPRSPSTETIRQFRHLAAMTETALDSSPSTQVGQSKLNQTVLDHLPGVFYVVGPDGRLKHWNARLADTTGFNDDELDGQLAYQFFRGESRRQAAQAVLDVFATGGATLEADLVAKDGTCLPMLFRSVRTQIDDQPHLVGMGIEATEQRAAEDALRQERDRFETLFDNLPTPAVHGLHEEGEFRVRTVNSAFETVFGYGAGEAEGRDLHTLIVPEADRSEAADINRRAVEEEGTVQVEVQRTTDAGPRNFHVQVAGRSRPDAPPEVYAIYTDITDRKAMEETLREREALLRSITENISDGIYRSDPERGIVYANEAFIEMFGYQSLMEVQEVDPSDLYARPDERNQLIRIDRQEGEIDGIEVEFERKDGSTFIGLLNSRPVQDESGDVAFHDGAITDITGRKEYERQLSYRYELEREIVDVSTQFINTPVEAIDGAIEEALGAVGAFVGADRSYVFLIDENTQTASNTHEWCDEGIAPHQPDLQEIPFSAMPWFIDQMYDQNPLMEAVSDLPDEASGLRSILQQGDIESLIVLPMTREETLVGFVGFDAVRDSRDWETDTAIILRVLADAIANALQRKAMEETMIEARQEAERANQLKSAFLANMSHEIRTPLTSIIGFAEAIGDEVEAVEAGMAEETEALSRFAGLIEQSGHRLLETLDAVLNLSKLEAGEMDIDTGPVNLTVEADEVVQMLSTQAESAGVDLQTVGSGSGKETAVWAQADEGGLRIVLRNLVSNAIKYTDSGGAAWVRTRQMGDAAVVEVEDTGIGMDPEQVPRVFEAFTQTAGRPERSVEGIGLGLAVTKRLVDRMSGTIKVETEKGEGTCFTVSLPRASDGGKEAAS